MLNERLKVISLNVNHWGKIFGIKENRIKEKLEEGRHDIYLIWSNSSLYLMLGQRRSKMEAITLAMVLFLLLFSKHIVGFNLHPTSIDTKHGPCKCQCNN